MPAPPTVLDTNQILLGQIPTYGAQAFPVDGGVQRQNVNAWPGKTVTGDYTRADIQLLSALSISDLSGGFLIRRYRPGQQPDRYWYGNVQTDRPGEILPLPATVDFLTGAGSDGTTRHGLPANSRLGPPVDYKTTGAIRMFAPVYVVGTGTQIYKFEGGTWASVGLGTPLANPCTSSLWVSSYEGNSDFNWMFFCDGQQIANFDGGAWRYYDVHAAALASRMLPAYMAWHDKKLYVIGTDNRFWVATSLRNVFATVTESFTELATMPAPGGECTGLRVFRTPAGQQAIYAVTARGLFVYDADADQWYETEVRYPFQLRGGEAAAVWGSAGELYIGTGTTMLSYNGNVVRSLGFDRDDGLPVARRCMLTRMADGYNSLLIAADASAYGAASQAAIYKWTGTGHHPLWVDRARADNAGIAGNSATSGQGGAIDMLFVSGAENALRVWWSVFNTGETRYDLYYIEEPLGLVNLWDQVARNRQLTGSLVTGWFDADLTHLPKLGVVCNLEADNLASGTRTIAVSYQVNNALDTDAWTALGTAPSVDTVGGLTKFQMPSSTPHIGVAWRSIRFKLDWATNDASSPPVLRNFGMGYVKRPTADPLYSYSFRVNLSDESAASVGSTPRTLEKMLDAAMASPTLLTLNLRTTTETEVVTKPVLLTAQRSTIYTGTEMESVVTVVATEMG